VQLTFSKKGKPMLQPSPGPAGTPGSGGSGHDREKKRYLELSRPFLRDLGVTDAQGALIPSMSRKWKQINKFIEVFDHALASAPVAAAGLRVADFGSGKGYLTFAMHDYLRNTLGARHRSPASSCARTWSTCATPLLRAWSTRGWSSSAVTCAAWCRGHRGDDRPACL
jgi:hypothetical protein